MTDQQQNKCLALLLAIALDGGGTLTVERIQKAIKNVLKEMPPQELAVAAGTKIEFGHD